MIEDIRATVGYVLPADNEVVRRVFGTIVEPGPSIGIKVRRLGRVLSLRQRKELINLITQVYFEVHQIFNKDFFDRMSKLIEWLDLPLLDLGVAVNFVAGDYKVETSVPPENYLAAYDVLHVERLADKDEIQEAFRQQAQKYHPDRNKDDTAEAYYKALSRAYKILKNYKKITEE